MTWWLIGYLLGFAVSLGAFAVYTQDKTPEDKAMAVPMALVWPASWIVLSALSVGFALYDLLGGQS